MTTNEKGRDRWNGATQGEADHAGNHSAVAQKIGSAPHVSKYRHKLNRRALDEVAERPLAVALLSALQRRGEGA